MGAVLAWRIARGPSSLATSRLIEKDANVVETAHRLEGCIRLSRNCALWADESVEKFLCIFFVNANARAMVPVLATSLTINHHAMIIRATAGAVLPSIIAFVAGGNMLGTRGVARMARAKRGLCYV
jgi:hypothetical protein